MSSDNKTPAHAAPADAARLRVEADAATRRAHALPEDVAAGEAPSLIERVNKGGQARAEVVGGRVDVRQVLRD